MICRTWIVAGLVLIAPAAHAESMLTSCYRQQAGIAAHKTLPFGTMLRVVYPETGRGAVVKVGDRGPFGRGRSLDVSCDVARQLGFFDKGVARLDVTIMGRK